MRSPWWLTSQGRGARRYANGPGRAPTPEQFKALFARYEKQQNCPKHRMACRDCGRPEQPHFCAACGQEGVNAGIYQHETPAANFHEFEQR